MMLQRFLLERSGNFGMMLAITTLPLLLAAGVAVDYSRQSAAHTRLQAAADAAALAVAASAETDIGKLRKLARKFVTSNANSDESDKIKISKFSVTENFVEVALRSELPTTLMQLANIKTVDVGVIARAERTIEGGLEVALVLDNTTSMEDDDGKGRAKIEALKDASKDLVETLFKDKNAKARVALVPFADYVNVGIENAKAPWLSQEADSEECFEQPAAECTAYASPPCFEYVDGVRKPTARCPCTTWTPKPDAPTNKWCAKKSWLGCVRSRPEGDDRLQEGYSKTRLYPRRRAAAQECPNPLITLTDDSRRLTAALADMRTRNAGLAMDTYLPGGLVWGWNVLSPAEPFGQGKPYDPAGTKQRKVLVLMSDGFNSRYFLDRDYKGWEPAGSHVPIYADEWQFEQTNNATETLCENIKATNIRIFSIGFRIDSPDARRTLENCASTSSDFFSANDSEEFLAAFRAIGQSLTSVRLVR